MDRPRRRRARGGCARPAAPPRHGRRPRAGPGSSRPGRATTRRASTTATSSGTSSMTTSERAWGSRTMSRASSSRSSPHNSIRRLASSRSTFATLMKTERVTADGAVRTASATIAWFLRSRPTGRTLIGAETLTAGGEERAASVATRICASPDRVASLEASSRASPRSPRVGAGTRPSSACRTRPRSVVSLTTIRAVRSAAMTLTFPPVGRSLRAAIAASRAAARRFGATSVAPMLAEVSMTSTTSRDEPGRAFQERSCREQHQHKDQQQLDEQQEASAQALPWRVGLDIGQQPAPQQRGRDDGLVASQLEQVHRDHGGDEHEAGEGERADERHRVSPGPGAGAARRTSGRRGSGRTRGRRSSPGASRTGPPGPSSRRRAAPCRHRSWPGPP